MSNSSSRRLSKLSKVTQQMNNFPTRPAPRVTASKRVSLKSQISAETLLQTHGWGWTRTREAFNGIEVGKVDLEGDFPTRPSIKISLRYPFTVEPFGTTPDQSYYFLYYFYLLFLGQPVTPCSGGLLDFL